MSYLMGIDLGSTSIKAVVYDYTGKYIASGSCPTPLSHTTPEQPAWCVWEPQQIWAGVVSSIKQALSTIGDTSAVKAVAVTGFGMDGLPIDANGKPLYPMISWHCPRTIPQSQRFVEKIGAKRIFDITGVQVMAINSIYRMMWVQENHPEILEKTDTWLLIEDFVNFMLCGEKATDYSMATTTSVFNHKTKDWSDELLSAANIPRHIFPKARQSGTVLGKVLPKICAQTGLSPNTTVVLGGHDYLCGSYAVGAVDDNVLMDITGTWEMLVQASSTLNTSSAVFDSGYYMEGHVAKDKYCYVASAVSGDMTEWLKNTLSPDQRIAALANGDNIWQHIHKALESAPPGSNGCMFLPHFSGAGAPNINPSSMGAFVGLQNNVTKNDMMRAVFEGLNYQFCHMAKAFKTHNLGNMQKIVAIGGATKNTFWLQNKADVTGLSLEVPNVYEATPLGAAMLAGLGIGVYKNDSEAVSAVRSDFVLYQPNAQLHDRYQDYYQNIYCKLQAALAETNAEISARFR